MGKKRSKEAPDLEAPTEETGLLSGRLPKSLMPGIPEAMFNKLKDPPIIAYDPEQLTNWRAILSLNGTIFMQPAVAMIIASQFVIALGIAAMVGYLTRHPEDFESNAMESLVKTIAVSIAFLLGMFLSSCINRWWDTIKSLESLFGTIKRLSMTAINLQVPSDVRMLLVMRCVLSARCLQVELAENHLLLSGKSEKEDLENHWDVHFAEWQQEGRISQADTKILQRVPPQQRSFFAWSLVSQEMIAMRPSLMSTDGKSDVMAYDRLCDLVQDGVSSVSNVRTAAAFQMPYVYVHLLAFMIHFVNLLTAVGTGVRVGLLIATSRDNGKTPDVNAMGTAMIFLFTQAFIYQAFLTIGAALSFPITGAAYRIPLLNMVDALEKQVKLMNTLADDVGKADKDIDISQYREEEDAEFFD